MTFPVAHHVVVDLSTCLTWKLTWNWGWDLALLLSTSDKEVCARRAKKGSGERGGAALP